MKKETHLRLFFFLHQKDTTSRKPPSPKKKNNPNPTQNPTETEGHSQNHCSSTRVTAGKQGLYN